MRSGGVPKSPMEYHTVPMGTMDSAKSDILVDRNRSQRKKFRRSTDGESGSKRMKHKEEKLKEELAKIAIPKLDLDQSVDDIVTSDILSTCHTLTCPVASKREKNENGSTAVSQTVRGESGSAVRETERGGEGLVKEGISSLFPTSRDVCEENGTSSVVEGRRTREDGGGGEEGEREGGERGGSEGVGKEKRDGEDGERGAVIGEGKEEREAEGEREGEESSTTSDDDDDLPSYQTNTSTEIVGELIS